MSGDLISRSSAIKLLRNYADLNFALGKLEFSDGIFKAAEYIEKDNIPVEYDMQKVIQQLEKWVAEYEKANGSDKIEDAYFKGMMRGYLNSIEIVKSGGIDTGQKGGV